MTPTIDPKQLSVAHTSQRRSSACAISGEAISDNGPPWIVLDGHAPLSPAAARDLAPDLADLADQLNGALNDPTGRERILRWFPSTAAANPCCASRYLDGITVDLTVRWVAGLLEWSELRALHRDSLRDLFSERAARLLAQINDVEFIPRPAPVPPPPLTADEQRAIESDRLTRLAMARLIEVGLNPDIPPQSRAGAIVEAIAAIVRRELLTAGEHR